MRPTCGTASERVSIDLFDVGSSPVANGADFACSWTGPHAGQLIVRSGVLHLNTDGRSAAIPRERIDGWTLRPLDDTVLLSIGEPDQLNVELPAELAFAVERALKRLQRRAE